MANEALKEMTDATEYKFRNGSYDPNGEGIFHQLSSTYTLGVLSKEQNTLELGLVCGGQKQGSW